MKNRMVVIKKYLYFDKRYNHYYIVRRINGNLKYFGYYPTLDDALCRLNYLETHNWELHPKCIIPKKYYTKHKVSGLFEVKKKIGGKDIYFGCFKKEDDAKKYVDYLMEHNWDLSLKKSRSGKPKYYYPTGYGTFRIKKGSNYYGTVGSEDDAEVVVSELKLVGWDWDLLSDSVKSIFN